MRKTIYLIAILFVGCVSTKELFTSLQQSEQDNYGYSKENPILIGQYNNWQKNADLAFLYLSKLKYNDKSLQCVLHATVDKPLNQPRKRKSIPMLYGTPTSLGGIFLDLYVMVPRGTTDTLKLYFDEEIQGEIKIPKKLEFDINQNNNIFR